MATYVYKARDRLGSLITGKLQGTSTIEVKDALASEGLFPVSVQPEEFELSLASIFQPKLKTKDLSNLTREFQVMFAAGTPMDRILATLVQQTKHKGLKEAMRKIQADISSGVRLSEAFAKHPQYFDLLYSQMLGVGETGGVLDKTLKELASIIQKEDRIRSKVKSATLYPKLVVGALIIVSTFMLYFVMPKFADFYSGHNAKLPVPTLIMIGASNFIRTYWLLFLILIGAGGVAWKGFMKTQKGKKFLGLVKFKAPIFGNLFRLAANARFGHLVSALYRAGLPLSQSLDVVADTIDNIHYSDEIRYLKRELDQGRSLSDAMKETEYFTPMIQETTSVGEQTGHLDDILESVASFYDEEIDDILKNLTTLIEPILLFTIFGLVALLALAVFLPVWNLSNVILGGGG